MPTLFSKYEDCSGCGACRQQCPCGAIEMGENEYGFQVPKIDKKKCVNCGLCTSSCPIIQRNSDILNSNNVPIVFAARHKSLEVLNKSTSGGAFTALVELVYPDYIFGAVFDKEFKVVHEKGTVASIDKFRGSKYVQSDTRNTFIETKKLLEKGKKVLYTGLPCQIAGLKMFLRREYSNLFTCDLLCEGVSSQHMFDEFINDLSRKRGEITHISFRSKERIGWEKSDLVVEFRNTGVYRETCQTRDCFYMNNMMFLGGCRQSCYACKFNKIPRQGDFTIGDLWGWREICPQWNDNRGISLLMLNSEKALSIKEKLGSVLSIKELSIEQAAKNNPNILNSTKAPVGMDEYIEDVKRLTYVDLVKKYHKPRSYMRKLLSKIKFILRR